MGFDPGCFWSAGGLRGDIGTGVAWFLGLWLEDSVARTRNRCFIRETLNRLCFIALRLAVLVRGDLLAALSVSIARKASGSAVMLR